MKKLLLVVAVLAALVCGYAGAVVLASESGEVVEVRTLDSEGQAHTTRLWIVDADGHWWLRGTAGSGWLARMDANPNVRITRGDEVREGTVVDVPEVRDRILPLFGEKYGLANDVVGLLLFDPSRSGARVLRFDPR